MSTLNYSFLFNFIYLLQVSPQVNWKSWKPAILDKPLNFLNNFVQDCSLRGNVHMKNDLKNFWNKVLLHPN